MIHIHTNGRTSMFEVGLFLTEKPGMRIRLENPDLVRKYGGTVAPLWKRLLFGLHRTAWIDHTLPASAPVVPFGSINIGRVWTWTDDFAVSAGRFYNVDLIYAVHEQFDISAVVIVKDRIPYVLSRAAAERMLTTGIVDAVKISIENFEVPSPENDSLVVATICAEILHSPDIDAEYAILIAKQLFGWLYPASLGPLPASANVFAEAFGFRQVLKRSGEPIWYRSDLGGFDQLGMAWASVPDSSDIDYLREIAPPGMTVISERLVIVERSNGTFYAAGLVDGGPIDPESSSQAVRDMVPVSVEISALELPHWFGGITSETGLGRLSRSRSLRRQPATVAA